jgi:hypothetical protein
VAFQLTRTIRRVIAEAIDWWLLRRLNVAIRRGMTGEHWAWFAMAAGAYLIRRTRRRQPKPVVLSERLQTGQRLLLTIRSPEARATDEALPD